MDEETDLVVEDCYTNPDNCEEYLNSTEGAVSHDSLEVVPVSVAARQQQAFPWPLVVAIAAGIILVGAVVGFFVSRKKATK